MRSFTDKQYSSIPDGFDVINDSNMHKGSWSAIQIVDAPVFNNNTTDIFVGDENKNLSSLSSILPAGMVLHGHFKKIKISSGIILAYKG